jgi:hypothetical protein
VKLAIDIGGVLSKYPYAIKSLIVAVSRSGRGDSVYILTDMKRDDAIKLLEVNSIVPRLVPPEHVLCADYDRHGDAAKAVLMREHQVDVLIDDHMGYLVWPWASIAPLRLAVMPDPRRPYNCNSWITEGDFGRHAYREGGGE